MRVRIGDKIYDTEKEPIMLIFTEEERKAVANNILNMEPKGGAVRKYLEAPDHMDADELRKFMRIDNIKPAPDLYKQGQVDLINSLKDEVLKIDEETEKGADLPTMILNLIKGLKPVNR